MKNPLFYDYTNNAYDKKLTKVYYVAAQIVLKYGSAKTVYTQRRIDKRWVYPESSPYFGFFKKNIKVSILKSFINTYMKSDDLIWSSDFLHGLMRNGKVKWSQKMFPSFVCYKNLVVKELIKNCPYGGQLNKYGIWSFVPALYLKYSEDSIQFMAGVLAGAVLQERHGYYYARFNQRVLDIIKGFGIPIEGNSKYGRGFLISPVWIALFTPWMPESIREKWTNIKKPFNADVYSAVLWKTYINSYFKTLGIPYLKSRRKIFYTYNMKELQLLRIELGLTELDSRIKDVVKLWNVNNLKEKKNEIHTD